MRIKPQMKRITRLFSHLIFFRSCDLAEQRTCLYVTQASVASNGLPKTCPIASPPLVVLVVAHQVLSGRQLPKTGSSPIRDVCPTQLPIVSPFGCVAEHSDFVRSPLYNVQDGDLYSTRYGNLVIGNHGNHLTYSNHYSGYPVQVDILYLRLRAIIRN